MPLRLGPGPVFEFEWRVRCRRWRMYAARAAFVAALLLGMQLVWTAMVPDAEATLSHEQRAVIGSTFFYTLMGIQLALVLMVAPAATAGAVCLDKMRGSLAHVLVTDVSEGEIIFGKFLARSISALGLIACVPPLMAIMTLFGGVEPLEVASAFCVTVAVALLGCAVALTLSVWGTKAHEVLLATYALWLVWLLACPIVEYMMTPGPGAPALLQAIDPFRLVLKPVFARSSKLGTEEPFLFAGCVTALSMSLLLFAAIRLRPVIAHQFGRPRKPKKTSGRFATVVRIVRRLTAPPLDFSPVLWREWHRRRPSLLAKILLGVYLTIASLFAAVVLYQLLNYVISPYDNVVAYFNGFTGSVGLLLLCVSAATALAEERTQGSLDVLMVTPLSTNAIVLGKWWGAYRTSIGIAIPPMLTTAAYSYYFGVRGEAVMWTVGLVLAYGAAITSLGLLLATIFKKVSTSVALCVFFYAAFTIGWPLLVRWLNFDMRDEGNAVAAGSPFSGLAFPLLYIQDFGRTTREQYVLWTAFWFIAYMLAALAMTAITLRIFDSRMGRAPEGVNVPESYIESRHRLTVVWDNVSSA